jgi:putative DNA primase/helicase
MNYRNLDDIIAQLQGAGLMLDTAKSKSGSYCAPLYIESAKSVRCDTLDKPRKRTGAYRLHELPLADGIWISGGYWLDHGNTYYKLELNKECADCGAKIPLKAGACPSCGSTKKPKAREIPPEEIERHRLAMAESQRQAEEAKKDTHAKASAWATAVWQASARANLDDHDYFARKGLTHTGGARLFAGNDGLVLDGAEEQDWKRLGQYAGALIVPLQDTAGKTWGLQFILSRAKHADLIKRMETDKTFWPDGLKVEGMQYLIGGSPNAGAIVCEGYATGVTLHEASHRPVAIGFNAGNLPKVTAQLRKRYKQAKLLIAADDDWLQSCTACKTFTPVETNTCIHCGQPHGKGNAGLRHAREAAALRDVAYLLPQFSVARPTGRKGPTDFNDLASLEGLSVVTAQIDARLSALEWDASSPSPARGDHNQGGGEDDIGWITLEVMQAHFRLILTTEDYFDHRMNRVWSHSALIKATPRGVVHTWAAMRERKFCLPEQVGFDPDGSQPEIICNLYDGWPTVPKAGKCDALLRLLMRLCAHESENAEILYDWVLDWHAYMLQHPGAKMLTSIIVHGDKGGGKNLFFGRAIKAIFGKYGTEFGQYQLEEKYNDWMSAKCYGIGNEVIASHESLYHMKGYIKNIITENYLQIRQMHHSPRLERNCLNMVFLSNELQPMNLERGDRRFTVIWTPDTPQKGELGYEEFRALIAECLDELANGGSAALHHFLLERDIKDFHEGTPPPLTKAKEDLIEISLDSKERFWLEWSREAIGEMPCIPAPTSLVYEFYRLWCSRVGVRSPSPESKLIPTVTKMRGVEKRQERYAASQKTLRSMFLLPHFLHEPPPGKSRSTWLGECAEEFAEKLNAYRGETT